MNSASRQAGWAAVANPQKARDAFRAWQSGETLDVRALVLARDFAVLSRKGAGIINALNRDLRMTTINAMNGR